MEIVMGEPRRGAVTISERLIHLSDFAIGYLLEMVKAAGTPVDPALILQIGEERKVFRIIGGNFEEKVTVTINHVLHQFPEIDAYALAYDVRIPYGNRKYDAIVSEVGEENTPNAWMMAQRYSPKKGIFKPFKVIGMTMLLGEKPLRIQFNMENNRK
jgi:hypothetical protein